LVQGRALRQCRYLRAIDLTSFPFAARQGPQQLRDRGGGRHRIPQSFADARNIRVHGCRR